MLDQFFASLREKQIAYTIRKLHFQDLVLFIWHPQFFDLLGKFNEKVSCYYVDEEFTGYYGMTEDAKDRIRQQEENLLRNCDLVFVNGRTLLETKNRHQNAINVPMGVDFELFSRAMDLGTPVPEDLATIPRPRIGYVGNVNDKVDFPLLDELAARHPDWSIVLVGPISVRSKQFRRDFEMVLKRPNFYTLGLKPVELLPNYIKGLDVCLMCYRTDGWAFFGYPLKLHEYLASGKPVVSSDLPSVREFSGAIRIATTTSEWREAIEAALLPPEPGAIQERVAIAQENTWENRVLRIENAITEKLLEKGVLQRATPASA